ncbi:MAG TPA: FtsX-like permease family protein [Streptosporangiaceae bacterium]|nr:FtsX-like permease family protein [Streptosporangiaceae bacterium]
MRGTIRWARADLRARHGQALLTIGAVAGVVAALVLATMLLKGAVNPWQALFARTHGADMVVYLKFPPGQAPAELGSVSGVQEAGGPYQTAPATLAAQPTANVQLIAMKPSMLPRISMPIVVAGSWLRTGDGDGVVVEASFAAAVHVRLGDQIRVQSGHARVVPLKIIGIADTADQGFYPQWTPGLIWVQPAALDQVQPDPSNQEQVADLRLTSTSPVVEGEVAQGINQAYPGSVQRFSTAAQVEASMASNDRLVGLLLAVFGIIALVAAPCAIANVTAGRVLMYRQDIAMLKALGFTPGQVVRMLVGTQTLLGIAGACLGVLAARVATAPAFVRPPAGSAVGLASLPGWSVTLIAAGVVATVAVATVIPAWWAGRVSPVAAVRVTPPRGHLSRIARLGLLVHLPAPLVLGARDSLTRRLPALLTVFGVAIPLMVITIALSCWSTIDGFSRDPARIGLAATLNVTGAAAARVQDSDRAQVKAAFPADSFPTLVPGGNGTFTALAIGRSAGAGRYPFHVVQGSMYDSPLQAVAGQGFLDLTGLSVGEWVTVSIDGTNVTVRIVGRVLDPVDNGDVLAFGRDSLTAAKVPPQPPQYYSVQLRPGVSAAAAEQRLSGSGLSGSGLSVSEVANPADSLGVVRVVIVVSVVILAVIALANLLTATAIGLRDHRHETGVLAALGLTPRQVMATLVVNTTILTLIGVTGGLAAGLVVAPRLINMQGRSSGLGAEIYAGPSVLVVAFVVCISVVVATSAAVALARRTMSGFMRNERWLHEPELVTG